MRVAAGTIALTVVAVACAPVPLRAQAAAPDSAPKQTPGTIVFPGALGARQWRHAFSVAFIGMPAAIVQEASSIRWPLFGFDAQMGLGKNFVATGTFSTEVVTNHLEVGARWQKQLGRRMRGDLGLGGAFWFGQLKHFGFDSNVHGTFLYPSASLGWDFGTMAFTAQVRGHWITSLDIRNGDIEGESARNLFDGLSYRLALEQPFGRSTTVGLAFQMSYLKFYYPQWPLFPTFGRHFWLPEAQIRITP